MTYKETFRLLFENGSLSNKEIEAILEALPVEIIFVDADDVLRFYSKPRIFSRNKSAIGKKIQDCHPANVLPMVNEILQKFKNGEETVAYFWMKKENRTIYIEYIAVHGREGQYLGCL
ncbi:MAG: PAS domain-containing protein, partial [Candidatus Ranarchaeia archaeon]